MWTMAKSRQIIWERCGGHCEVSGRNLEYETFDAHHRRNKGMGGTSRPDRDAPYNLLALDPQIHNGDPQSVHARRGWAEQRGYLVSKFNDNPELVPVMLPGHRWVLLGIGHGYIPLPARLVPTLR